MIFPAPSTLRRASSLALVALGIAALAQHASGYSLNGKTWPTGSNVILQLGLGSSGVLTDGSPSWDAAVLPALTSWNQQIQRIQLAGVLNPATTASSGDKVNSVVFSNSVFGQSFGSGTLAVTYYVTQGSNMIEADVLFNRAQSFDSYRGRLRFGSNGYAIADVRRVFLHEMGHGIGLNHQEGDNIMAAMISDRETLSGDDIAGVQTMYGAPVGPPPTPTPLPTATPAPTPAATPAPPPSSGQSRLANISTRMRVGVGDGVLIAGFIIQGADAKKLILRATGPSLAAAGVSGALQDPVLEVYDVAGNLVAQNDDWQTGGQAAEITATGVAPTNVSESALVLTLQPGTYTAMVHGRYNGTGVALVEAYELTAPATKLANLSTRGFIGTGDEVLIGGLIVQGTGVKKIIIRAIGPSLRGSIASALSDPTLEVYDGAGQLIASNDNWTSSAQQNEIIASTVPPTNPLESAAVLTLSPGNYTAIVRGVNNTTGIGVVEVYDLGP